MPLSRFLHAYYAYVLLFNFMLGYAIYTVYFQLSGLNVWDIALFFTIWSLVAAVFDIPSGALADHFDRRWREAVSRSLLSTLSSGVLRIRWFRAVNRRCSTSI